MAKKTAKKSARKPNAAFMKPMTPSPALSEVIGSKAVPRTEVTKKLWAYIKKNKLQDQKNKRMIKADDALKPVFGGKAQVNMFEMTKLVNKHLKAWSPSAIPPARCAPAHLAISVPSFGVPERSMIFARFRSHSRYPPANTATAYPLRYWGRK